MRRLFLSTWADLRGRTSWRELLLLWLEVACYLVLWAFAVYLVDLSRVPV